LELIITKDKNDLERLEGVIHKNLQSFYEVGRALMEIRNRELYKIKNGGKYQTFETYCKGVWDFTGRHAERLMGSVSVIENTRPMGRHPENERQARQLACLDPEKQIEVWQKAVETAPGGKVTAAHIKRVVKEMTKKEEPKPEKKETSKQKEKGKVEHYPTYALNFATIAISQLERIPDDDPKRVEALDMVEKWLRDNK